MKPQNTSENSTKLPTDAEFKRLSFSEVENLSKYLPLEFVATAVMKNGIYYYLLTFEVDGQVFVLASTHSKKPKFFRNFGTLLKDLKKFGADDVHVIFE